MEKTTLEQNKISESLSLMNRKNLKVEGIVEINSSSENLISLKLKDTTLTITGQNMHITKLDVNTGVVEVDGLVNCIKYGKNDNFFKRIFK
ncbi:MAG: YabP/YqfC family sporulation protein [Christensenellales bacterium]